MVQHVSKFWSLKACILKLWIWEESCKALGRSVARTRAPIEAQTSEGKPMPQPSSTTRFPLLRKESRSKLADLGASCNFAQELDNETCHQARLGFAKSVAKIKPCEDFQKQWYLKIFEIPKWSQMCIPNVASLTALFLFSNLIISCMLCQMANCLANYMLQRSVLRSWRCTSMT